MAEQEITTLRATAHPLRLRMLSLLTGTALSAAEVARELEITHANASYHLRLLRDADLLVVDGEERIRGGVAKRYRYPHEREVDRNDSDPSGLDLEAIAREMVRRSRSRAPGRGSLTDAEMWVTPETWQQVVELVVRASTLLHDNAARPRTEGTTKVNLTVAAFRMEDR